MKIFFTTSVNQNKKLISNNISVLITGINNIFQSSYYECNSVIEEKYSRFSLTRIILLVQTYNLINNLWQT
jgi:hypothetical protein